MRVGHADQLPPRAVDVARRRQRAAAPRCKASATKSCPSCVSPLSATNRSPLPTRGCRSRRRSPSKSPGFARRRRRRPRRRSTARSCDLPSSAALARHFGVVEMDRSGRRRSDRSRGPCRRSAAGRRRCSPPMPPLDRPAAGRRSRSAPAAGLRAGSRRGSPPASSLRGLSSVTMTRSARRVAISPIIGRLPRSRSPPQPNTTTQLPLAQAGAARQHGLERVGLVRVVDIDRARRRRGRHKLACGPARRSGCQRRHGALPASPPVPITRPSAASTFSAWKPPASGSSAS